MTESGKLLLLAVAVVVAWFGVVGTKIAYEQREERTMEPCATIVLRTQWGLYLLDSEKGWRPIKEYPHAADWPIPGEDGVYLTVDGEHVVGLEPVGPSSGWVIPTPTAECPKESCSTCGT